MDNQTAFNRTTPLFMVYLYSEIHLGPDVWVDATAGRRFFKDPEKYQWVKDQDDHASMMLEVTFENEVKLELDSQEYRLNLALQHIDNMMEVAYE